MASEMTGQLGLFGEASVADLARTHQETRGFPSVEPLLRDEFMGVSRMASRRLQVGFYSLTGRTARVRAPSFAAHS